jgi:hypothetical protein
MPIKAIREPADGNPLCGSMLRSLCVIDKIYYLLLISKDKFRGLVAQFELEGRHVSARAYHPSIEMSFKP